MPEGNPPPTYRWAVAVAGEQPLIIEAAYPVLDDGCMILKSADHKIVFAAPNCAGCTFERLTAAAPASGPVSVTGGFPANCACTYTATWNSGVMTGRWARNINWACPADHTEVDRLAVVTADSGDDKVRL